MSDYFNLEYGNYGFMFLDDIENPAIQLYSIGAELRTSSAYSFDCMRRPEENCYLFQYTLSGSGIYKNAQSKYEMTQGMAFLAEIPGEHVYYLPSQSKGWELIYIMFRGSNVQQHWEKIIGQLGNVSCFKPDSRLISLLCYIYKEARDKKITDAYISSGLTFQFLMELCRAAMKKDETGYSKLIDNAMVLINKNIANLYGPEELSADLKVSKNHLIREFTREIGDSPGKYICKLKIQKSAGLLAGTDSRIDEIALLCGFSCGNYFCKVFRRYMGMTPSEFRLLKSFTPFTSISL